MCVEIVLNATVSSNLDWSAALKSAESTEKQGRKILWHLDLGLFDRLRGLTQSTDFHALALALDHFVEKIWGRFSLYTQGVILYTGFADLTPHFPWDETLRANYRQWLQDRTPTSELERIYCWHAASEYVALLTRNLPDGLPLFVRLDMTGIESLYERAQLLNPALLPRVGIAAKNQEPFWSRFDWDCLPQFGAKAGLCLPITTLTTLSEEVLLIPEEELTAHWDGLDRLYYDSQSLSVNGKRKLQGFVAAGGEIISLG